MGISQVQVSRMEKKIHSKFKRDDALRNRIVKGIFFHGCQILRSE